MKREPKKPIIQENEGGLRTLGGTLKDIIVVGNNLAFTSEVVNTTTTIGLSMLIGRLIWSRLAGVRNGTRAVDLKCKLSSPPVSN